jgi:hypothetical protein
MKRDANVCRYCGRRSERVALGLTCFYCGKSPNAFKVVIHPLTFVVCLIVAAAAGAAVARYLSNGGLI